MVINMTVRSMQNGSPVRKATSVSPKYGGLKYLSNTFWGIKKYIVVSIGMFKMIEKAIREKNKTLMP